MSHKSVYRMEMAVPTSDKHYDSSQRSIQQLYHFCEFFGSREMETRHGQWESGKREHMLKPHQGWMAPDMEQLREDREAGCSADRVKYKELTHISKKITAHV